MEQSLLGEFFARHPSASGASRAGNQYQIICLGCGAMLAVELPDAARQIDITCAACGWEEHIRHGASTG